MSKNPMQDIVPKGKSIRDVPLPETRVRTTVRKEEVKRRRPVEKLEEDDVPVRLNRLVEKKPRVAPVVEEAEEIEEEAVEEPTVDKETLRSVRREFEATSMRSTPSRKTRKASSKNKKRLMLLGLFVGVIVLAVLVSGFFNGASISITPRTAEASIQNEFTARKGEAAAELAYQILAISGEGSESVKATGERQVERRATGTIVIYNNYSATAQRLIKNTRFTTPEGLVFRISDSVNVPGKKGDTPGSVEAVVTADEPGDKYNVGLKDFTIPGFKGDPRYTSFYARSKTPIQGGFSGVEKIVAESDREKAKTNIRKKIEADLVAQIDAQIPPDRVVFENGWKIEYKSLPEETVSDSEVKIKEEGTLTMVLFDREQLSSALAKSKLKDYSGDPIVVTNIEDLSFTPKEPFSPASASSVVFAVAGDAKFEWVYDETALKGSLAGQPRSAIPSILQKYPMIQKADISLRPLWARKFPASPEKITIEKGI